MPTNYLGSLLKMQILHSSSDSLQPVFWKSLKWYWCRWFKKLSCRNSHWPQDRKCTCVHAHTHTYPFWILYTVTFMCAMYWSRKDTFSLNNWKFNLNWLNTTQWIYWLVTEKSRASGFRQGRIQPPRWQWGPTFSLCIYQLSLLNVATLVWIQKLVRLYAFLVISNKKKRESISKTFQN